MAITKAQRQEVRALKRRNVRWAQRLCVVEGVKCIQELVRSGWDTERIYCTPPEGSEPGLEIPPSMADLVTHVNAKDMEMMSNNRTPPGWLALAHMPLMAWPTEPQPRPWLFLDNLKDPGNVGTLIRVADWFGLGGVVASPNAADPFGPKAIQSSMGSVFHVPVVVSDWQGLPPHLRNHVVGLDAGGTDMFAHAWNPTPSMLVVGSESHGISQEVRETCHVMLSIPGAGRAESLNASVAGAIALGSFVQATASMPQRGFA